MAVHQVASRMAASVALALATALSCGVLATVRAQAAPPSAASRSAPHRLVVGYYVPYDATSWYSLEAHADQLDVVAAQWVTIDACGNLGSSDDRTLLGVAQQRGLRVVPSLLTLAGWLNHQLLTDPDTSANAIAQVVDYTATDSYAGFDLDLEGVLADDRDALSEFVAQTAAALHARGKILTLAIPAKERDVRTGWAGPYDYAALGAAADLVTVMAYEYRGPFSGPGSVAPVDWVQRVSAFAASQIPPEKLLLGLAFYGYDWNTTTGGARSLGYAQAAALAERYGADVQLDPTQQSLTFAYDTVAGAPEPPAPQPVRPRHDIATRTPAACDFPVPPQRPAGPRPAAPAPGTPQSHAVWLEESGSAAARMDLAARYGMAGVATWRLGFEDPAVWPLLTTWRAS